MIISLLPSFFQLFALVTSLVRKKRELRPITLFLLNRVVFDLALFLYSYFYHDKAIFYGIWNVGSVSDVLLLYYYFFSIVQPARLRKLLFILTGFFIFLPAYFWLGPMHKFYTFSVTLYGIDNLFIVVPCFIYFYQIIQSDELVDLGKSPHFFIVCGLIFFYGTTFPFYISYNTLYSVTPVLLHAYLFIDYILTSIFYITVIKAYLCPQAEEKSFSS